MNPSIRIGLGHSNHPDAFASGRQVAATALRAGKVEKPDLVLAFGNGALDAGEYFRGLQSVVGPKTPVLGGSAVGVFTNDFLSYRGFPAAAAVLQWEGLCRQTACATGLDRSEYAAGRSLGSQLSKDAAAKLLLLFYDSIRTAPTPTAPPILNASPPLMAGIEATLGQPLPIIGAGLVGGYDLQPTHQFCGSAVVQQAVAGALLGGNVEPHFRIMHGCVQKDGIYHTITRMDGPCIYEVDGRPILELIDESYGDTGWRAQHPVKRLAIGVNHGEKYGEYREDEFVNRLITGVLPGEDGIMLFEPDLREGTEFLFMLRDGSAMIESAKHNCRSLKERVTREGKTARLGLYIDCAGRTAEYSETLTEEADEVRAVFNEWGVPLLGFYSGVEVAPLLGRSRGLDWTGVLLVLAEA